MSAEGVDDLTNGIGQLPPRREVRGPIDAKAWRFIAAAALVLAAGAMLLAVALFKLWSDEATERRDQNCESFEGDHYQEARDLGNSYQFLLTDARSEWDSTQRFVFERALGPLELDAARDDDLLGARVPDYCDDPGVGLPEPDPCVPRRPPALGESAAPPPAHGPCRKVPLADAPPPER